MQSSTQVIRQNAFVVNDIDEAALRWVKAFGIGPFFCMRHLPLENVMYRGRPAELDISTAVAFSGDLSIELIVQHNDGPSAYRDTVPKGKEGFHHMLAFPKDYDGEVARYQAQGFEIATSAMTKGVDIRFCYADTRASLGAMMELVSNPDWSRMWGPMIDACRDWDGTGNPIVEGRPGPYWAGAKK